MFFEFHEDVPFPRDAIFQTIRDDLRGFSAYLRAVDEVTTLERRIDGDKVEQINRWKVPSTELPGLIRAVFDHPFVEWTETSTWNASTFKIDWNNQLVARPNAVTCRGTLELLDEDDNTVLRCRGELRVHTERIEHIPPEWLQKGTPAIERVVIERLEREYRTVSKAVEAFVDARW